MDLCHELPPAGFPSRRWKARVFFGLHVGDRGFNLQVSSQTHKTNLIELAKWRWSLKVLGVKVR